VDAVLAFANDAGDFVEAGIAGVVYFEGAAGAKAELAETRRAASLELTQALRNVHVAEADYAVSAKTREINAETVRLSKISFLNGSGTSFDLVLTERQLRVSEADLAVSEFSVLQAKIAALLALSTCNLP